MESCISLQNTLKQHQVWGFYVNKIHIISPDNFIEAYYNNTKLEIIYHNKRYGLILWKAPNPNLSDVKLANLNKNNILIYIPQVGSFNLTFWKRYKNNTHVLSSSIYEGDPRHHGKPVYLHKSQLIIGMFYSVSFQEKPFIIPCDVLTNISNLNINLPFFPNLIPYSIHNCIYQGYKFNGNFRQIDFNLESQSQKKFMGPKLYGNSPQMDPVCILNYTPIVLPPTVELTNLILCLTHENQIKCVKREINFDNQLSLIPSPNAWITHVNNQMIFNFNQFLFLLNLDYQTKSYSLINWSDETQETLKHVTPMKIWWIENNHSVSCSSQNRDPCFF